MARFDKYGNIILSDDLESSRSAERPSSGKFWFLTIALAVGLQFWIQLTWGKEIVGMFFGYDYSNGLEGWGVNLAVGLGPWGFGVFALLGTYIYNKLLCSRPRLDRFRSHHYILSVVISLIFSALWGPFVIIGSAILTLIWTAIVIIFLCFLFSGS